MDGALKSKRGRLVKRSLADASRRLLQGSLLAPQILGRTPFGEIVEHAPRIPSALVGSAGCGRRARMVESVGAIIRPIARRSHTAPSLHKAALLAAFSIGRTSSLPSSQTVAKAR